MMTLLYVETHVWRGACVVKLTSSACCSWWWLCYMSKRMCGEVLVLSSWRLVSTAAGDDFVICRNARVEKCLCCQADVYCVLQLMMTLLYVEMHVWTSMFLFEMYNSPVMEGGDYGADEKEVDNIIHQQLTHSRRKSQSYHPYYIW